MGMFENANTCLKKALLLADGRAFRLEIQKKSPVRHLHKAGDASTEEPFHSNEAANSVSIILSDKSVNQMLGASHPWPPVIYQSILTGPYLHLSLGK